MDTTTPEQDNNLPEVNSENYALWLRARRPSDWFFGLSQLEQEALASVGDGYTDDCCIRMGEIIGQLMDATLQGFVTGQEAVKAQAPDEEKALQRLAANMIAKKLGEPVQEPSAAVPVSFGGITERREAKEKERQVANDKGRTFMGQAADPPAEDVAG